MADDSAEFDETEVPAWMPVALPPEPGTTFETKRPAPAAQAIPGVREEELSLTVWTLAPASETAATLANDGSTSAPPHPMATPGAPVFRIGRLIGRGGMGEVYEARQESMKRTVAVKRVRADLAARHPEAEDEFRLEALVTASLEHPNIVPVHDLGVDSEGRGAIAMKLVRGRSWSSVLRDDFPSMEAVDFLGKHLPIFIATAQAVAFAHTRGVVHRDLKPSQVMTGEFGEVVLMDWGLALRTSAPGESIEDLPELPTPDSASSPSGTPAYMAPEQAASSAVGVGPWTDIYLLGAILHELLTGKPPHAAPTSQQALLRAMKGALQPLSAVAPPGRTIPPELESICLRAMEVSPQRRYATATELVAAVQDYVTGAARRREAAALTGEARHLLEGAQDYDGFTAGLDALARARSLWPPEESALALENDATERYARLALRERDLRLAAVLGARLRDADARGAILAAVAQGEARARRELLQRRVATGSAVALLVALLGASGVYLRTVRTERDAARLAQVAAERARAEAERAREETEDQRVRTVAALESSEALVEFMMTDLRSRLAPRDPKLELLDAVSDQVIAHYRGIVDASAAPSDADVARALPGILSLVNMLTQQGRGADAAAISEGATRVVERMRPSLDPQTQLKRTLAVSGFAYRVAEQAASVGKLEKATRIIDEDYFRLVAALEEHPEEQALYNALTSSISLQSVIAFRRGNAELMESRWAEALDLLDRAERMNLPVLRKRELQARRARAVLDIGIARDLAGDPEAGVMTMQEGIAGLYEILAEEESVETLTFLASGHYRASRALDRLGRRDESVAAAEQGLEAAERVLQLSPGDMRANHLFANAVECLVRVADYSSDPGRYRTLMDRALAALRDAIGRAPDEIGLRQDLVQLLTSRSEQLLTEGDFGEALDAVLAELDDTAKEVRRVTGASSVALEVEATVANARYSALARRDRSVSHSALALAVAQAQEALFAEVRANPNVGHVRNRVVAWQNAYTALEIDNAGPQQLEDALRQWLAAVEFQRVRFPLSDPGSRMFTAAMHAGAEAALERGDFDSARERNERALNVLTTSIGVPDVTEARRLADHLLLRARIERLGGNEPLGREYATRAESLVKEDALRARPNPQVLLAYVLSQCELGRAEQVRELVNRIPGDLRRRTIPKEWWEPLGLAVSETRD